MIDYFYYNTGKNMEKQIKNILFLIGLFMIGGFGASVFGMDNDKTCHVNTLELVRQTINYYNQRHHGDVDAIRADTTAMQELIQQKKLMQLLIESTQGQQVQNPQIYNGSRNLLVELKRLIGPAAAGTAPVPLPS